MAVSHVFSNARADWTGTVTIFNSQASTTTTAATDLVRPVDWDSAHNEFITLGGNTSNASTVSGTNVVLHGLGGVTLVGSTGTIGISVAPGTASLWHAFADNAIGFNVLNNGRVFVMPTPTPIVAGRRGDVQMDRLCRPFFLNDGIGTTGTFTWSHSFGLYTRNASTLSLLYSTSNTQSVTYDPTAITSLQGVKLMTIPWTTTIPAGYYYAVIIESSSTSIDDFVFQPMCMSKGNVNNVLSGFWNSASTRVAANPWGWGTHSVTSSALPSSMAISDINASNTGALFQPMWFGINGTV